MNSISRLLATGLLLLGASFSSHSIQVGNLPGAVSPGVTASTTIERGGKIDSIDLKTNTLVVDKVKFRLAAVDLRVHDLTTQKSLKIAHLKAGTLIRFTTSKANYASEDRVTEIWVTRAVQPPSIKTNH